MRVALAVAVILMAYLCPALAERQSAQPSCPADRADTVEHPDHIRRAISAGRRRRKGRDDSRRVTACAAKRAATGRCSGTRLRWYRIEHLNVGRRAKRLGHIDLCHRRFYRARSRRDQHQSGASWAAEPHYRHLPRSRCAREAPQSRCAATGADGVFTRRPGGPVPSVKRSSNVEQV